MHERRENFRRIAKLSPEEIDIIFFRAADLRQHVIAASPELLAAIDEADESFEKKAASHRRG